MCVSAWQTFVMLQDTTHTENPAKKDRKNPTRVLNSSYYGQNSHYFASL